MFRLCSLSFCDLIIQKKNLFISGFKNVSEVLAEKTQTIGGAKDLALDLQKRANDLAAQASNKLSFLSGKIQLS